MKRIKGINVLKAGLLDFAEEIMYSLTCELQRISRRVEITELKFNPFNDEISTYMDAIRLDEKADIVIDTSFADTSEKFLRSCISDLEIDFFGLIDLLELLKGVPGKNGALPSIFTPVTGDTLLMRDRTERLGYAYAEICLVAMVFIPAMKMVTLSNRGTNGNICTGVKPAVG